jgi:hypothetical protein
MKKPIAHLVADMDRRHQEAALHVYRAAYRTFRDPHEAFNLAKLTLAENRPDLPREDLSLALQLLLQYHGFTPYQAPEA